MLRFFIVAFILFPAALQASDPAAQADWTSCQSDADCVVVGSICPHFYWAINRKFIFANTARNAGQRQGMDCAVSFQARPTRPQCNNKLCTIPLNRTATAQINQPID